MIKRKAPFRCFAYIFIFIIFAISFSDVPAIGYESSDQQLVSQTRSQIETLQQQYISLIQKIDDSSRAQAETIESQMKTLQSRLDNLLGRSDIDDLEILDPAETTEYTNAPTEEKSNIASKISNFIKKKTTSLIKTETTKVALTLVQVAVKKVQVYLSDENYKLAATVCEEALEKAREIGDEKSIDELGALYAYTLYKSGDMDKAQEALEAHEEDRLPSITKRVEEALSGTEFDPEYIALLDEAMEIHKQEAETSKVFGKKPSFMSHFNPFYQVSRIKDHFSKKSFHKKMDKMLNRAYKKLADTQYNYRRSGYSDSSAQKAVAKAEAQYNAVSALATDYAVNPDTRIADTDVQLFDPANLFASSEGTLYDSLDDLYTAIECAKGTAESPKSPVRFLNNSPEAWMARWYMLKNAKHSIDTTYFIIDKDFFGYSFIAMLFQKAKEGLNIRLMIDASGVAKFKSALKGQDYLQELLQYPNVKIRTFNPYNKSITNLFKGEISKIIASNHDKIIVVDDEYCMTGGRNVAHHYFVDPSDDPNVFMDTDVLMKSPEVAAQLKLAFSEEFARTRNWVIKKDKLGNWFEKATELDIAYKVMDAFLYNQSFDSIYAEYENDSQIKDKDKAKELIEKYVEWSHHYPANAKFADFVPFEDDRLLPVKILDKHSAYDERNDITTAVINAMDTAKEEIVFQNPYIIFTKRARAALVRASRRGVRIICMSNGPLNADHAITQATFLTEWKELLRDVPNMELMMLRGPEMLHSKTFVFDKKLSIIGTYNMDPMSEQINSEVVAVINDEALGEKHYDSIMKRLENADRFTIKINSENEIEEDFGAEKITDKKTLKKYKIWSAAKLVRPLI